MNNVLMKRSIEIDLLNPPHIIKKKQKKREYLKNHKFYCLHSVSCLKTLYSAYPSTIE